MTDADDLTESDEEILDELQRGSRTKGALVDATGLHRNTVGHRLDILEASGLIDQIHDSTALYELVDDPRETGTALYQPGDEDPVDHTGATVDVEDLREERDRLEEELKECRDRLEAVSDVDLERVRSGLSTAKTALEGQDPDTDMAKSEIEAVLEEMGNG